MVGPDIALALAADAAALGVALTPEQADQLARYAGLIAYWNAKIRLVGPDDVATIARDQVVDALAFAPAAALAPAWWDIGSGAGLPGLVLAVLAPERHFVLVEPVGKKVAFLEHAAGVLGLKNVGIVHGRVGDHGEAPPLPTRPAWAREAPRAALTRATFAPALWVPMASRLVGPGGIVIVAVAHESELAPIGAAAGAGAGAPSLIGRWDYAVPASGAPRCLAAYRVAGG